MSEGVGMSLSCTGSNFQSQKTKHFLAYFFPFRFWLVPNICNLIQLITLLYSDWNIIIVSLFPQDPHEVSWILPKTAQCQP